MGKLTGLLMIVAGVGTAAYVYPMVGTSADKAAEKQLADVVAITTAAEPKRSTPAAPMVVTQAQPPRVISADTAAGRPALTTAAPSAAPAPAVTAAAPQVVAKPVEPPVPQPAKRLKIEDEGKVTLTRDIQRELKRVGCLQGDADGTWNASTKQAMKQFIDRVNATLPTDEPDHILKTLVQGHPGNACGKSCPAGQTASTDGRCLPTAIMTQGPAPVKRPAAAQETASITPSVAVKTPPAPVAPQTQESAPKATSAWETSVTTVAPPAMAAIAAAAAAVIAPSDTKPLPGRMAVGAAPAEATPTPPVIVATPAQDEPPKTKFVVKPKAPVAKVESKPDKPEKVEKAEKVEKPEKAEKVEKVEKPEKSEKAEKPSRPSVGAVSAAERSDPPRRVAPPSPPTPRVAVYRAPPPPPRYVGAYSPPPAREFRPRFGPQIFRQMELSGR
jgi:hypothetical protein